MEEGQGVEGIGYDFAPLAQVVELVDALASGASVRKDVKVRVLSWAPQLLSGFKLNLRF